jgi:HD-like signal output (HDOD) protein
MQTMTPFPRETLMHVVKSLPSAPQVLARLRSMLADPNVDIDDITKLLKVDAALTARIIRVANSPVYCVGTPYASIEQAISRVGLREIYTIAGFAAVMQMTNQDLKLYGSAGADIRVNSLLTALILEELARKIRADAEEAYSAGLLRSIGKIALNGLVHSQGLMKLGGIGSASHARPVPAAYNAQLDGALGAWESQVIGMNNCEVAGFVMGEWHFPETIATAITQHYTPEADPAAPQLTLLLNLAAGSAERLGFGLPARRATGKPGRPASLPSAWRSPSLRPPPTPRWSASASSTRPSADRPTLADAPPV